MHVHDHSSCPRILTFDIEEWFHILDNDSSRGPDQWSSFPKRIHDNTDRILDLLARTGVRASFFCLGWIAEEFPEVVKKIDRCGYEIGSHTHLHQLAYEQTPEEFKRDVCQSIDVLSGITGKPVRMFRVPGFSIGSGNRWCFDILADCGIEIDSSVFPAPRGHGGYPDFPATGPSIVQTDHGELREFPINVVSILGKPNVFSGGGYFRLFPWKLVKYLTGRSPYVMTYFHPRDFDASQPMVPGLPLFRRFKSYWGLGSALGKLERWINAFRFTDITDACAEIDWSAVPRVSIQTTETAVS